MQTSQKPKETTAFNLRSQLQTEFSKYWNKATALYFQNDDISHADKEYAVLGVQEMEGNIASLGSVGNRLIRYEGEAIVQIFTPAKQGTQRTDELAEKVTQFFINYDGDFWFREHHVMDIGASEYNEQHYHQEVIVQFIYDRKV